IANRASIACQCLAPWCARRKSAICWATFATCSNSPALPCLLWRASSAATTFSSAAVKSRVLPGGAAVHPRFATASNTIALSQRMSSLLGLHLERQAIHRLDVALLQRAAQRLKRRHALLLRLLA